MIHLLKTQTYWLSVGLDHVSPCLLLSILLLRSHRNRLASQRVVSLVAQMVKNLPTMQETWVRSLGRV